VPKFSGNDSLNDVGPSMIIFLSVSLIDADVASDDSLISKFCTKFPDGARTRSAESLTKVIDAYVSALSLIPTLDVFSYTDLVALV